MSSWRDRAAFEPAPQQASGGWRSRAAFEPAPEPGILEQAGRGALNVAGEIGEAVDAYTGAPVRSAIGAAQSGKGLIGSLGAAWEQIGEDTSQAPSGKQIMQTAGVPDTALSEKFPSLYSESGKGLALKKGGLLDPTASGAAGLAVDIAADPTNLIPGKALAAAAKVPLKAARGATGLLGKGAGFLGRGIGKAAGSTTRKMGSLFTGVPEKEIETYLKNFDQVNKVIAKYGDSMPEFADELRDNFQRQIQAKKTRMNEGISKALTEFTSDVNLDAKPIFDEILNYKSRLNPKLRKAEIKEIDDLIETIKSVADENGNVAAKDLFDIKGLLQDRAKGSYPKDGQIFTVGKDVAQASKRGAAIARKLLNSVSPEIAAANNHLSKLHMLEQKMNKNLISSGKPDASLFAAGSGQNQRAAKQLGLLGKVTGVDMLKQAEVGAVARRFAKPGWTSADTTGKGVERLIKAGVIAQLLGGPVASAVAVLATSPMALKAGIKTGKITEKMVRSVVGGTFKNVDEAAAAMQKALETEAGRQALRAALQSSKEISIKQKEPKK